MCIAPDILQVWDYRVEVESSGCNIDDGRSGVRPWLESAIGVIRVNRYILFHHWLFSTLASTYVLDSSIGQCVLISAELFIWKSIYYPLVHYRLKRLQCNICGNSLSASVSNSLSADAKFSGLTFFGRLSWNDVKGIMRRRILYVQSKEKGYFICARRKILELHWPDKAIGWFVYLEANSPSAGTGHQTAHVVLGIGLHEVGSIGASTSLMSAGFISLNRLVLINVGLYSWSKEFQPIEGGTWTYRNLVFCAWSAFVVMMAIGFRIIIG